MKAYEAYRESGVEWVGSVPVGWSVIALKRDLRFLTSGSRGWADHYADEGALFLRIGNLTRDGLELDLTDIQRVAVPAGAEGERTRVEPGDVLFSITAFMGSVAVVPANLECAYVSQHVALARLRGDLLLPRWVGYVTLSAAGKAYLDAQCYGGTKIQLSLHDVANLPVAVPSMAEQIALTAFLDQETGKIDALVAEQERLIALLKEKRQAVISQAVTKGLNPNAPMKDSGIEWLGQVPAHWTISKTSHLFKSSMGQTILAEELVEDGQWPVFSATEGDHYFGRINNPEVRLDIGDIVIPARGNSIGNVKLVWEPSTTTQTTIYCKLRTSEKLLSRFAYHYFRGCKDWLFYFTQTAIPQITVREVNSNPILLPPKSEQAEIADFIEKAQAEFDTLITEATQAITLLRERRAALISAAVTGKIDVRAFIPTTQEAA